MKFAVPARYSFMFTLLSQKGKPRIRVSQLTAEPLKDEKARRGAFRFRAAIETNLLYIYYIYLY